MNYWIFQVNSEAFLVDQFLHSLEKGIWWRVTRFKNEINKGDFVFFWQSGTHRGIRAVWKIDTGPRILPAEVHPSEFWVKPDREMNKIGLFADCRVLQHFPVIEENILTREPGLRDLSILKFRNATNYPVTYSESKLIRAIIKSWAGELHEEISSNDVPERDELSTAKIAVNTKPARIASSATKLLQCGTCNRYIVSSDTDRHICQAHAGQQVEWKETR
jgi:hypothetical protein